MAHNICYSTLVMDEADKENWDDPAQYYAIQTDLGIFRFKQGTPAVLPGLLTDLSQFRAQAKRDMARAKADAETARVAGDAEAEASARFRATLLNGRQLAYKIVMNSVYGATGASQGMMPCVPIATSITATGREMILATKRRVEELVPGSTVVYGDTDSVMVILNLGPEKRRDRRAHFEKAEWVADRVTKMFKPPIRLEFEKVYDPYVLLAKKRYFAGMYTEPDAMDCVDAKGIQLVRRDCPPLAKDASSRILDALVRRLDPDEAVDIARQTLLDLLARPETIPLERFVVSKTLRDDYKDRSAQPHALVADAAFKRTGTPVPSGVRVPYVISRNPKEPNVAKRAIVSFHGPRCTTAAMSARQIHATSSRRPPTNCDRPLTSTSCTTPTSSKR